jgi:septum formation protein
VSAQPLVLASASPRRLDLLRQIGLEPTEVIPTDIDETPRKGELPRALALRLARAKADTCARARTEAFIVAADTVVAVGRRVLGKAADAEEARRFLELLSGRRHKVVGGVSVIAPGGKTTSRVLVTSVAFKRLDAGEIESYLQSDEWQGKAGAYAIQGRAARFAREIVGSYSNVVGLSLFDVAQMLTGLGYRS